MRYEDYLGVCPKCGDRDFGEHTVLNGVDQVLQVPSLLARINQPEHGHIIECSHCLAVYEINNGIALMEDEIKECKEMWDEMNHIGKFKVGTRFIGNVDQAKMEVVEIKTSKLMTESGSIRECSPMATIKNNETGKTFKYGLQALDYCDVTILEDEKK